jgi:hypothetical protein
VTTRETLSRRQDRTPRRRQRRRPSARGWEQEQEPDKRNIGCGWTGNLRTKKKVSAAVTEAEYKARFGPELEEKRRFEREMKS